jgi:ribosomal protein L40E
MRLLETQGNQQRSKRIRLAAWAFLLIFAAAGLISFRYGFPPTGPVGAVEVDVQFCTNCGAANEKGATFCKSCGQRLVVQKDINLEVTAKNTSLYAGDKGVSDEAIGGMGKGAKMQLIESGTERYKVLLKGDTFRVVGWVDKNAVGGSVASEWDVSREIDHPCSAEETSAYLHRYKRDYGQLMKLKTWGHLLYQGAIERYRQALEYEKSANPEVREKAKRRYQEAEQELNRVDLYIQRRRMNEQ